MKVALLAVAAAAVLVLLAARFRGPVVVSGAPGAPAAIPAARESAPAAAPTIPLGGALTGAGNPLNAPSLLKPVVTVAPDKSRGGSVPAGNVARPSGN